MAGFTREALEALRAHPWPGNVRELRNAVERAIVLGDGELIRVEDLPPLLWASGPQVAYAPPQSATPAAGMPSVSTAAPPGPAAARSLRELEREGIVAALAATNGNKAQAAAILEIDRSTLYKKIKDYGIDA